MFARAYFFSMRGTRKLLLLGGLLVLSLTACDLGGETTPLVIDTSCSAFWEHRVNSNDTIDTQRNVVEHNAVFNILCPTI